MKRTMAIASFLTVGAGALGVGAGQLHMRGSDTLFQMINQVLAIGATCGGGADGLNYVGGGSGNASSQMKVQQQEAGPMSSFLNTADTCVHPAQGVGAEGIVWALDGLSMVADKDNVTACGATDGFGELRSTGSITVYDMNEDVDGTPGDGDIDCPAGVTCSPSYALQTGANNNWRDVLNVLYFGVHNNNRGTTNALDGSKMCGSDLRYTLAGVIPAADPNASPPPPAGYNAYSQNFEGGCAGGGCTRIEHLWRRGDDSGTTDTFVSVVCGSFSDADCQFCNGVIDTNLKNDDGVDFDPIRRTCRGALNPAANSKRTCNTYKPQTLTGCADLAGQTQLSCGSATATQAEKDRRWSLGLVQPVVVAENVAPSVRYPTVACVAPNIRRAPETPPGFPSIPQRCPCGEPIVGGACTIVSTGGGTPNASCFYTGFVVPSGSGACNPKVFNNEIRNSDGTLAVDPTNRQYLASAFRMRTQFAAPGVNCTETDSTSQIGCLTANIGCTMGFAGREGCDPTNASNDCMEVRGVEPTNANVRAGTYPVSRNLFYSTMYGFELIKGFATGGAEMLNNTFDPDGAGPLVASGARTTQQRDAFVDLAGCLSSESTTESIITGHGFITNYDPAVGCAADGRGVRCRDFNETQAPCSKASNVDSCLNNNTATAANGAAIPFAASLVETGAGIVCD